MAIVRTDGMVFVQYFGCGQFNPSAKDCIKCDVFQAVVRDRKLFAFHVNCGQKRNSLIRVTKEEIHLPGWSSCSTVWVFF